MKQEFYPDDPYDDLEEGLPLERNDIGMAFDDLWQEADLDTTDVRCTGVTEWTKLTAGICHHCVLTTTTCIMVGVRNRVSCGLPGRGKMLFKFLLQALIQVKCYVSSVKCQGWPH
jgi:hypothetical protein